MVNARLNGTPAASRFDRPRVNVANRNVDVICLTNDRAGMEAQKKAGYLEFDGWRTLTWNNPNYVADVRNRELRKFPLYPEA